MYTSATDINDQYSLAMNVFPNPFSEKVILQMDLTFAQTIHLEMINISGKSILHYKTNLESGKQKITLDVENNIPAGIYFLSVKNKHRYSNKNITKLGLRYD